MIRGFKYRFYPTPEQIEHLSKVFGHSRFVYNWILAKRKIYRMTYGPASAQLTLLKKELDWLNEVSCVPLQQTLRHQQRAFVNFAQKRAKFPTFKKKTYRQSVEYTQSAFTYRDGVLVLTKLGVRKIVWSHRFKGEPTTVHVSKTSSGRYYVSLRVDAPLKVIPFTMGKIGIDLGLTDFAVTSDNQRFQAPKPLFDALKQLKRAQQTWSRRQKGSKNRIKARIKVAKILQKVADVRTDWLQKLSTRFEYKSAWYGRKFVPIGQFFPRSKLCGDCGQVLDSLPLVVRTWTCGCGAVHDRDLNAARNILAEGIRLAACGETVRPERDFGLVSAKQEPLASCA